MLRDIILQVVDSLDLFIPCSSIDGGLLAKFSEPEYLIRNLVVEFNGKLVGDVSLRDDGEVAIVVCKEYQNLHIGRRCIKEMLRLAAEKGMNIVKANIYSFNKQSQRMFESIGFYKAADEWYHFVL